VVVVGQEHAQGIAKLMEHRIGVRPTVATSDDPGASKKIAEFTEGSDPWIVAVRMVSEGVDIPRLAVGVYATNTLTDLFFRQAVGRLVRTSAAQPQQRAYMFIPDDPRLRGFAAGIAEQRRHSLRKPDAKEDDEFREAREAEPEAEAADQLSLFAAISAIPLDEEGKPLDLSLVEPAPGLGTQGEGDDGDIPGLVDEEDEAAPGAADFELTPDLAHPVPTPEPDPVGAVAPSRRSRKRKLREENSACVRRLEHRTRLGHAAINAELNRRVGIRRITEATAEQLEKRLGAAQKWLNRL